MNKKPESPTPNWKLVEKVVRLIEQTLAPDAKVLHDQKPFDHSSDGERQGDTIIVVGTPPRETTTLVEIQDRAEPLGIHDLQGFYQKMLGVHAQHLICVTVAGFTKQALNFAANTGPTIRLATLAALERSQWPLNIAFGRMAFMVHDAKPVGCQLKGSILDGYELDRRGGQVKIDLQARIFQYKPRKGPAKVYSCSQVFGFALDEAGWFEYRAEPYRFQMNRKFGSKDRLKVKVNGRIFDVGEIIFDVELTVRPHFVPVEMHGYQQQDYNGVLAWASTATGAVDGKQVSIRTVFLPQEDGTLSVAAIEVDGVPRNGGVLMHPLADPKKFEEFRQVVMEHDETYRAEDDPTQPPDAS